MTDFQRKVSSLLAITKCESTEISKTFRPEKAYHVNPYNTRVKALPIRRMPGASMARMGPECVTSTRPILLAGAHVSRKFRHRAWNCGRESGHHCCGFCSRQLPLSAQPPTKPRRRHHHHHHHGRSWEQRHLHQHQNQNPPRPCPCHRH